VSDPERFHREQQAWFEEDFSNESRKAIHESWLDETSASAWLHERMFEMIRPYAVALRDGRWLTIGDSRYCLDSVLLRRLFDLENVLPSDVSSAGPEEAKAMGLIDEYAVENVESLSFEADDFDVVFCKETYHHLPRPSVGLYEMLRVARQSVILIEPQAYMLSSLKRGWGATITAKLASKLKRGRFTALEATEITLPEASYEQSGNYVYRLSYPEVEQIVRGLGLPGFAWKGFCSCYIKGVEFARADEKDPVFRKIKSRIDRAEEAFRLDGAPVYSYPKAVAVLFKRLPSESVLDDMRSAGFEVQTDTTNPMRT
jgi:2-polyprenyl-3-methyl-5-hydroxy-6-metoxy-1,4-benzoquinol methylase